MGGLATLPFIGKYFRGAEKAAPVAEKAVETVTQAPSYFFDLIAKIKLFGKEGVSVGPRQRTYNFKDYEMVEDVTTGDVRVTKYKGDPDQPGYKEEVMEYEPGGIREEGGNVTSPRYEEGTVFADMDGKMKDFDMGIEPDSVKEIIKDASQNAPSIKKAGGGIARMLGE